MKIPYRTTPEFCKYAAEVMLACSVGKTIEVRKRDTEDKYITICQPKWDWSGCDYRVKPELKPWTRENNPFGKGKDIWVRCKDYPNTLYKILNMSRSFVVASIGNLSYKYVMGEYEYSTDFVTWKPCVQEE